MLGLSKNIKSLPRHQWYFVLSCINLSHAGMKCSPWELGSLLSVSSVDCTGSALHIAVWPNLHLVITLLPGMNEVLSTTTINSTKRPESPESEKHCGISHAKSLATGRCCGGSLWLLMHLLVLSLVIKCYVIYPLLASPLFHPMQLLHVQLSHTTHCLHKETWLDNLSLYSWLSFFLVLLLIL